MTSIAIYHRIINFGKRYDIFKERDKLYDHELSLSSSEEEMFDLIYLGYISFFKYLKYMYRDYGINLGLYRELLDKAVSDNIISDTSMIERYMDCMNAYYQTSDTIRREFMKHEIVKEFRELMYFLNDFFNSERMEEIKRECAPINDAILAHQINLDDSIPEYKSEEVGITEYSYNLLIDYFKSNPEIKSVWLYGSRVLNCSYDSSDIDMLIDCAEEKFDLIKAEINNLKIPYFTDPRCINAEENEYFVRCASYSGTKRIYVK